MIMSPMLVLIRENEGIIVRNGMWIMADCKEKGYAICVAEPYKVREFNQAFIYLLQQSH